MKRSEMYACRTSEKCSIRCTRVTGGTRNVVSHTEGSPDSPPHAESRQERHRGSEYENVPRKRWRIVFVGESAAAWVLVVRRGVSVLLGGVEDWQLCRQCLQGSAGWRRCAKGMRPGMGCQSNTGSKAHGLLKSRTAL